MNNVLFVGSPYWCDHLAGFFKTGSHVNAFTRRQVLRWLLRRNKVVCFVGMGAPTTFKRYVYHKAFYLLERCRVVKKRVVYWIGSDTVLLKQRNRLLVGCVHIAGSPWLAAEIQTKGHPCEVRIVPVRPIVDSALAFPATSRMQVLCYVPDEQHELHGSSEIQVLVEQFPDVEFTVIGGKGTWWPGAPLNIRFLGWVGERLAVLKGSHVLLRRTSHDSMSAFVREGLLAGRHVIFTYDIPGVVYVEYGDIKSLKREMGRLVSMFQSDKLLLNRVGPQIQRCLTETESQLKRIARDFD